MAMSRPGWTVLLAALLAPGCGGPSSQSTPGSDGAAGTAGTGSVDIFYMTTSSGSSGGVGASFSQMMGSSCSQRTVGPCSIARCDVTGSAPTMTNLSAGAITITGGTPSTITISPASDGSYDYTGSYSFTAGEALTVSAAGATVPAFSAMVTFPTPITVTSPTSGTIDRTQDLALAWTGGSASVVARIEEGTADRGVVIRCEYAASAGSGTIPSGALSDLEAVTLGSGANQGDFSIESVSTQKVTAGGIPVTVSAGSVALTELPVVK